MRTVLVATLLIGNLLFFLGELQASENDFYPGRLLGKKIVSVDVVGPQEISPEKYRHLVPCGPGDPFTAGTLDAAIRALYQLGDFQNVVAHTEEKRGGVALIFYLKPHILIQEIEFDGNRSISDSLLLSRIHLREGEIFYPQKEEKVLAEIRKTYEEEGYYNANVSLQVCAVNHLYRKKLTFSIEEGKQCQINSVRIRTAAATQQELRILNSLYNAINLEKADPFAPRTPGEATERLKRYLARNHYLDASLTPPSLSFNADKTKVDLLFPLQWGARYLFYFSGNLHFSKGQLKEVITSRAFDFFGAMSLEEAVDALLEFYRSHGFAHVRIKQEVEQKGDAKVLLKIEEGERVWIKSIEIIGNPQTAEEYRTFVKGLPTRLLSTGYFYHKDFEEAAPSLESYLQGKGFLNPKVMGPRFIPQEGGKLMTVEFTVEEGVQTLISSIDIGGNEKIPGQTILKEFGISAGSPLDPHEVELAIDRLYAWYQNQGYYHVRIDRPKLPLSEASAVIRLSADYQRATVKLAIEEGPQVRIGNIFIRGNEVTKERVILRELTLKTGDILKPSHLRQNETKLARLGLFSQVTITPMEPQTHRRTQHLVIRVREFDHGVLEFGGGYSLDDGIRGFAGIAHRNLWGMNRTASFYGKLNRRFNRHEVRGSKELFVEGIGTLSYLEPRLFDTHTAWRNDLQYAKEGTIPFDKESYIGSTSFERQWGYFNAAGKYQLEWRNIFRSSEDESERGRRLISAVIPTFKLDYRNNPFYPTRGSFQTLTTEYASPALGSDRAIHYLKIYGGTNWYFPVMTPIVLALSLRAGFGKSLHPESAIPIDKRYYLGGRETLRGFKENSLGVETVAEKVRINTFLNYKSELRFPIYQDFLGALFQDGGGVFMGPDLRGVIRNTAGVSLQYKTPVGPVGLDFAFLLDKRPEEKILRLHFSIGTF